MVVEQKVKKARAAKKIQIIKDMDFSVVTHDGLVISCKPSKKTNKLYCVFSTVELQAYFGITEGSLEKRERSRMREVVDGEMRAIHVAIRNQGFENFLMFEVACFESIDEAAAAEKLHILNYKTYNAVGGCGYNSSPGGQTGGGSYSEADGKTRVNESIDFYYAHNKKWPNKSSADEYEKSLGNALCDLRKARNNPDGTNCKFHASYQTIADERGVSKMFFSEEELKNWGIEEFAQFIKDNGRPPQKSIKEERTLYQWMANRRFDIRSGNPKRWTPSNNETAIQFGVRHYFED